MINNFKYLTLVIYIIIISVLWYLQSQLYISSVFYKIALIYFLYTLWRETDTLLGPMSMSAFNKKIKPIIKTISAGLFFLALYVYFFPHVSAFINSKQKYEHAKQRNQVHWLYQKDEAYAQADLEQKPIIVEFFADWCMPCRQMEINTFSDQNVQSLINESYIALKVDASRPTEHSNHMMNAFKINAFPSIILFDQKHNKQKRLTGYIDAYQLKKALQGFLDE